MKKIFILFSLIFCFCDSFAQDSHYWSSDYSPAGFILPGAVITNNRDSGVVFYNPALLAYSNKNSANISGNLYKLQSIRIKNGVGSGKNLTSTAANIVPQLVSGTIRVKLKKPFTIGYALVQDQKINFQASQQYDDKFNVLDDRYSPGTEYFLGQSSIQNKINQTSAILSGGFKLNNKMALGFAAEAMLHTQFYSSIQSARAIINDNRHSDFPPFVNAQELYQANVTHGGIRFKTGFSYDEGRHHLGVLVTSPLLKLYSKGSILSDNVLNNLIFYGVDTLNLMVNARQTGLKANWKIPFSVAAGYSYEFDRAQIHITAEYFTRVSDYNVIINNKDYFARPTTDINALFTPDYFRLRDARKPVLNVGVGLNYSIKENIMGYLSARLDNSYFDKKVAEEQFGFVSNISRWNNIHWQVGANLKKRRFNLRAGLLFTYGHTRSYEQVLNFDSPREENFLEGDLHNTTAHNMGVKLLLAYIYNF